MSIPSKTLRECPAPAPIDPSSQQATEEKDLRGDTSTPFNLLGSKADSRVVKRVAPPETLSIVLFSSCVAWSKLQRGNAARAEKGTKRRWRVRGANRNGLSGETEVWVRGANGPTLCGQSDRLGGSCAEWLVPCCMGKETSSRTRSNERPPA